MNKISVVRNFCTTGLYFTMRSLFRIVEYLLGWLFFKSKDNNSQINQQIDVLVEDGDATKKIIQEAITTGDLDELRKKIAE